MPRTSLLILHSFLSFPGHPRSPRRIFSSVDQQRRAGQEAAWSSWCNHPSALTCSQPRAYSSARVIFLDRPRRRASASRQRIFLPALVALQVYAAPTPRVGTGEERRQQLAQSTFPHKLYPPRSLVDVKTLYASGLRMTTRALSRLDRFLHCDRRLATGHSRHEAFAWPRRHERAAGPNLRPTDPARWTGRQIPVLGYGGFTHALALARSREGGWATCPAVRSGVKWLSTLACMPNRPLAWKERARA